LLSNSILSPLRNELALVWLLRILALMAGALVLLIFAFLLNESLPILGLVGLSAFFSDPSWHPMEGFFNLTSMLLGTLYATAGSVLLAAPLGILSAIFCRFYAPTHVARIFRNLMESLSGVPSVVFGFWGLTVLVPLVNQIHPPGPSLFAGISILTMMILPTMAMAADASFASVPQNYLRGAQALGLSKSATLLGVVLPAAKAGLLSGLILQSGRAIGETMALLMVCGNVVQTPKNIFDPIRTLTTNIALEMAYAMGSHRSALFVSGLILMLFIVVLLIAAEGINRVPKR